MAGGLVLGGLAWPSRPQAAAVQTDDCAPAAQATGVAPRIAAAPTDISALEHALSRGGPAVRRLVRRTVEPEGGPLVPVGPTGRGEARQEGLRRAVAGLPLAAPLAFSHVTSGFGVRADPITRHRAMHEGIDLEAPYGATVCATAPGRVDFAGIDGGYGRMVEIDHGNGVHTRYGHLSAIGVWPGQRVAAGQEVGRLGTSGRSTGPHLHYEVRVDGKAINPTLFLQAGRTLDQARPMTWLGGAP